MDADEESDYEEVTSDLEDVDDLRGWLSSMSCKTMGLIPHETFVRKYLPPGTVADLFEHYKSTQKLLGGYCASLLGRIVCIVWFFIVAFIV